MGSLDHNESEIFADNKSWSTEDSRGYFEIYLANYNKKYEPTSFLSFSIRL